MNHTAAPTGKQYKTRKKRKAPFRILLFLSFVLLTLLCGVLSYNYVMNSHKEAGTEKPIVIAEGEGIEIEIPKGSKTTDIAELLVEKGLIKNAYFFKLLSKINGYDGYYQSGTHIVSKSLDYDQMMRVLTSKPVSKKVTIPEGKTFLQIVDILYNSKVIENKDKFIRAANTEKFDYEFLKDLPPRDNRLEGYLFPDTYEFDLKADEKEIIRKMLDNFQRKMRSAYMEKLEQMKGMTLDRVIILASIIEREAKQEEDRFKISGVFYNRMKSKDKTLRKLQSCATIQYILLKKTGSVKERLLDEDLAVEDPYNTYKYEGLPPGPICCPGEEAIKAALYPEETNYLYFVAKGDGSHEFSRTYKEHQAAIKKYGLR